jgi:hypothetical protein
MKRGSIAAVQTSVERRQRSLLSQIATQRAILARAEALLAELTAELHETAPGAYGRMLEQKTAEILQRQESFTL